MLSALCCPYAYADETYVVPMGRAAGIQVYTDGLLVIGLSETDGRCAAKDAGICVNDRITKINGNAITTSEDFAKSVNEHPEGLSLEIVRDNIRSTVNVPLNIHQPVF